MELIIRISKYKAWMCDLDELKKRLWEYIGEISMEDIEFRLRKEVDEK